MALHAVFWGHTMLALALAAIALWPPFAEELNPKNTGAGIPPLPWYNNMAGVPLFWNNTVANVPLPLNNTMAGGPLPWKNTVAGVHLPLNNTVSGVHLFYNNTVPVLNFGGFALALEQLLSPCICPGTTSLDVPLRLDIIDFWTSLIRGVDREHWHQDSPQETFFGLLLRHVEGAWEFRRQLLLHLWASVGNEKWRLRGLCALGFFMSAVGFAVLVLIFDWFWWRVRVHWDRLCWKNPRAGQTGMATLLTLKRRPDR